MAKREKKIILMGVTCEQMEQAFSEYATADANIREINAVIDAEFTKVRESQADRLAELAKIKENAYEVVQVYAVENRENLFKKRKSVENIHGVFGFRTGTPKLKTKKGLTWTGVLELLKIQAPKSDYIRTVEELAKDKLLSDRENEETIALYPKIGVEVVQDEAFFIELKKENNQN